MREKSKSESVDLSLNEKLWPKWRPQCNGVLVQGRALMNGENENKSESVNLVLNEKLGGKWSRKRAAAVRAIMNGENGPQGAPQSNQLEKLAPAGTFVLSF